MLVRLPLTIGAYDFYMLWASIYQFLSVFIVLLINCISFEWFSEFIFKDGLLMKKQLWPNGKSTSLVYNTKSVVQFPVNAIGDVRKNIQS